MQAVILAAGYGKRLRPLTDSVPKALAPVNGKPLIINALNCLSGFDISEVIVVVGHRKGDIISAVGHDWKGMRVTYVENPDYETTNNVYSFWLAKNYIKDDCVLLECDLYYKEDLISSLLSGEADCNILVSPYDGETMNGTVVFADKSGRVTSLVIKRDQNDDFDYTGALKTVNAYLFRRGFIVGKLMPGIDTYVKTQSVNSYYELVIGAMIYYGNSDIRAARIGADRWYEIDDMNDLAIAEAARL